MYVEDRLDALFSPMERYWRCRDRFWLGRELLEPLAVVLVVGCGIVNWISQ
jgi:hypothetical protein